MRFAIRLLIKDKWFTLVATVALALGIGVNATVSTFVNAVLIRENRPITTVAIGPDTVSEQHDCRGARPVVLGSEVAAEHRRWTI